MNERLAGACLDLLELCRSPANGRGARPPCDSAAKERLWKVAEMLLRESAHAPAEQFDIVYDALRSPIARGELPVRRALMVVLEGVAPGPVYRLFEAEDLIAPAADAVEGASRRASLEKFIHALLGRLEVPDGLTAAEVLRAHAEDFKRAFPTAALSPAFLELEKNAVRIAAQARLIKLLAELFAAFDKERTGKVPLAEFQRTAERVLGKEMTGQLLEGVRTDAEGNLAYAQLTALLTQLPPSQIREKNQ